MDKAFALFCRHCISKAVENRNEWNYVNSTLCFRIMGCLQINQNKLHVNSTLPKLILWKGDSTITFPVALDTKYTYNMSLWLEAQWPGYPTLNGISHVNQSDWDDETLAGGSAAYGNRSRNCCLRVHSTDDVLWEAGKAMVYLLLMDSDSGRSRHHLKTQKNTAHIQTRMLIEIRVMIGIRCSNCLFIKSFSYKQCYGWPPCWKGKQWGHRLWAQLMDACLRAAAHSGQSRGLVLWAAWHWLVPQRMHCPSGLPSPVSWSWTCWAHGSVGLSLAARSGNMCRGLGPEWTEVKKKNHGSKSITGVHLCATFTVDGVSKTIQILYFTTEILSLNLLGRVISQSHSPIRSGIQLIHLSSIHQQTPALTPDILKSPVMQVFIMYL